MELSKVERFILARLFEEEAEKEAEKEHKDYEVEKLEDFVEILMEGRKTGYDRIEKHIESRLAQFRGY